MGPPHVPLMAHVLERPLGARHSADGVVPPGTLEAPRHPSGRSLVTIAVLLVIAAALAFFRLLVEGRIGPLAQVAVPLVEHILAAGSFIAGVLAITQALDAFVIERLANPAARYNLKRVLSLMRAALFTIAIDTPDGTP